MFVLLIKQKNKNYDKMTEAEATTTTEQEAQPEEIKTAKAPFVFTRLSKEEIIAK